MARHVIKRYFALKKRRLEITLEMGRIAWQICPTEIQDLLCGESGIFDNVNQAGRWLTKDHPEFSGISPIEAIMDGRAGEVEQLIAKIDYGIPP